MPDNGFKRLYRCKCVQYTDQCRLYCTRPLAGRLQQGTEAVGTGQLDGQCLAVTKHQFYTCNLRMTADHKINIQNGHNFCAAMATHTHTYKFLSGWEEVENRTSQLVQPHNTTLLHEFYLATTQMLEYMPSQHLTIRLPHRLAMYRWSEDLANILDLQHWTPQHSSAST